MSSLRDQFAHFYVLDEDAIATAMKTGLVVPDTNVLLNLYRFQATAREELFGALEKAGERLWIPHQVGLEFQRNRLSVMKDQEGYFAKTRDEVLGAIDGLHGKVRAFGNRLGLGAEETKKIDDGIVQLNSVIADVVLKAEGLNEVWLVRHASDTILARIDALFENGVGSPMEPGELEAARKEAERRIREKIPPGYKDRAKDDATGDYIVWRQTMTEAASRKLPVVFITDDSRSDDWYRREHGLTLGARYELREEMNREAGVPLLMITTERFLRYAKAHLDATVSEETVEQAKEIPGQYNFVNVPPGLWSEGELMQAAQDPRLLGYLYEHLRRGRLNRSQRRLLLELVESRLDEAEAAQITSDEVLRRLHQVLSETEVADRLEELVRLSATLSRNFRNATGDADLSDVRASDEYDEDRDGESLGQAIQHYPKYEP